MPKGGIRHNMTIKILLSVAAVLVIAGVGFFIKMKYEQSKMQPLNTQEIIPGIFVIKNDFVNFFLIKDGDKYIAIDAGLNSSKAQEELQSIGVSNDDVVAVFLTHTHSDHTGALSLFDNAVVYVGKDGIPGNFKVAYEALSDGENVDVLNTSIQCISTPGHTNGSVCYLIDGKYLFVGDTLSLQNNKVGLFNSFYNRSDEVQATSIQKLAALSDIQYVFSAHYGFTDNAIFPFE